MVESPSDRPPFQPLDQRLAGHPIDDALYPGVPEWLIQPLRDWFRTCLSADGGDLARRAVVCG
jgi:hypothetical protein